VVPCTRQISSLDVVANPFLGSIGLSDWRGMRALCDVRPLYKYMSYLWIQDTCQSFLVAATPEGRSVPCQALRRWCAEALGSVEWDWRLARMSAE
jgi:hypothetical protein